MLSAAPFRSTGKVSAAEWTGSGVLTDTEYTFFTAGHVLYDSENRVWVSGVQWTDAKRTPPVNVRSFRVIADYASMANESGGNSVDAFRRDCAVGFAYQSLGEFPADRSNNPTGDLTSDRQKLITGYSRFGRWQSKAGPFSHNFNQVEEDFYVVEGVSLGAGGSGGGLWTSDDGNWKLSAIYVAGLDTRAGDASNIAGVVALSPEKWNLLTDAKTQINESPPAITSQPDKLEIKWGISEEIRIEFSGFPFPEIQWEKRDPSGFIEPLSGGEVGPDYATYTFDPNNLLADGTAFRVVLSSRLGTATSNWIPIQYAESQIAYFTEMPNDLVLGEGESGFFEASVEAYPPADLQWQVLEQHGFNDVSESRGMTGSRSARLEIPSDNTYFADSVFRLRASNAIGTVYSDPVHLTVPIPDLGGQYLGVAKEHLELDGSFSIGAEVFNEYGGHYVVWRITHPTGSYEEYEEGNDFPPFLSWIEMEGDSQSGYRVRVTNDGSILRGTVLEAVIRRPRLNLSHPNVEDEVVLPPIVLRADGSPRFYGLPEISVDPETGYGARQYFSASPSATVEWQLWDDKASLWRPVDLESGWAIESDEVYSELSRLTGGIVARVRAVLREAGNAVDQSEVLDLIFPDRGSDSLRTLKYDLPTNSEVIGTTAFGPGVVTLLEDKQSGEYRLVSNARQAYDWEVTSQKINLPEIFGATRFNPIAGDSGFIALGNYMTPAEDGIMAGSIVILKQDLTGRWQVAQVLRIPEQEFPGGFPYDLKLDGKTLIAGSLHTGTPSGDKRRMHFFHLKPDGRFAYVDTIKEGHEDLPETWGDYAQPPIPFGPGFLAGLRAPGIPPAWGPTEATHELAYVEMDENTWRLQISYLGKTMVPPDMAIGDREAWAIKYWQQGTTLHRIRIDGEMNIVSDTSQLSPSTVGHLAASDGSIICAKRTSNNSYLVNEDPMTFYRVDAKGQLQGPATMLPHDWDSSEWPYTRGDVFFGDEHVYVLHVRGDVLRVDVERKEDLRFSYTESSPEVWVKTTRNNDGQSWNIRFRKARSSGPKVSIQYSYDLKTWHFLPEGQSALIMEDADGDLQTELREISVPVSQGGGTILYRIIEEP
jgi:hypothetical protein